MDKTDLAGMPDILLSCSYMSSKPRSDGHLQRSASSGKLSYRPLFIRDMLQLECTASVYLNSAVPARASFLNVPKSTTL